MKDFQYKRFVNVLRYLGFVKWRTYANLTLIPLIVAGAIFLSYKNFIYFDNDLAASNFAPSCVPFFMFIMLGFTSYRCVKMMTSTGRVGDGHSQFLALPASSLEKFISAIIMRIALPVLCAVVGFYVAVLVTSPTSFGESLRTSMMVFHCNDAMLACSPMLLFGMRSCAVLFFVASMSTFIFCGLLFSRFKWLIAFFAQVLCSIISGRAIFAVYEMIDFSQYNIRFAMLVLWLNIVFFVISAALLFCSYLFFKRSQAVRGSFLAI